LAAARLGVKATIVMPKTTPTIKVQAVKRLGGRALLHGDTFDEAREQAAKLVSERELTLIPPYDDPDVIAGNGTIGVELLRQHQDGIHAIFVPVGGGGLISGIALYVKYLRPDIKVIGVEPEDAGCMFAALRAGRRVTLDQVGLFADGVAVRQAGKETFKICRRHVDEVVLVSTDEICAAVKDIYDDTRSIAEPAGALAVAGLKRYVGREGLVNETLVAINSGANLNFDRLRHVAERAELGEHREALLAVTIPERSGSFRQFCHAVGKRNITEFNYRYADSESARIFVGLELADGEAEKNDLIAHLRALEYPVLDLTDNEMAKLHVRYMVGGHAPGADHEELYRFQFPERPGALLRFLTRMGNRWNISLFHYRNHGAAYGRVLAGVQVAPNERRKFEEYLDELGYPFWQETQNPAYQMFLGG
jgi:threonine dehydratase